MRIMCILISNLSVLFLAAAIVSAAPNSISPVVQFATERQDDSNQVDASFHIYLDEQGHLRSRIEMKSNLGLADGEDRLRVGNLLWLSVWHVYDGDEFIGAYSQWNESGSIHFEYRDTLMPDVALRPGWRVEYTEHIYDIDWRDGSRSEEELQHWFHHTWWIFNSVVPEETEGYRYVLWSDKREMNFADHLAASEFTIHASYVISSEAVIQPTPPE